MRAFFPISNFSRSVLAATNYRTNHYFPYRMSSTVPAQVLLNKLSEEKSPYLLQHQHNPINWYSWGEDAFALAKDKGLPVFLSVGYSTCHWCHVMEKESFENVDIAKILNDGFVAIKVDREERPDVDKLYMSFITALSGHGGWPMSVFLTPNLEPFFGGTYWPREDYMGRPGFKSILKIIAEQWAENPSSFLEQGKVTMEVLSHTVEPTQQAIPPLKSIIDATFKYKATSFDSKYGGFGTAPKFPKASDLEFLVAFAAWNHGKDADQEKQARLMLDRTLEAMNLGGIHDHVAKGFHRYSVDEEWHVPHFEKMLYDQAQLMALYADYSLSSGSTAEWKQVIRDIADYMLECLRHSSGGFYAAEDADSLATHDAVKKTEGAFCVWEKSEIETALKTVSPLSAISAADLFCQIFDVQPHGNVEPTSDPHGELKGKNVLRMHRTLEGSAEGLKVSPDVLEAKLTQCKKALQAVRSTRPPPHLDSKFVTAWQGLAISAFAKASAALTDENLREVAEKTVEFVRSHLRDEQGYLLRTAYRGDNGQIEQLPSHIEAFSDDYAFVIQGLLDLYHVSGDESMIRWAVDLQQRMDEQFFDEKSSGGYFISAAGGDEATSKVRIMEDQDGAEPCTNSVAVNNLVRLWELTGDEKYKKLATQVVQGAAQKLTKYPYILTKMVPAIKRLLDGHVKVVIVGGDNTETNALAKEVRSRYIWNGTLVVLDKSKGSGGFLTSVSSEYQSMLSQPDLAAFVCVDFCCGLPVRTREELRRRLDDVIGKDV